MSSTILSLWLLLFYLNINVAVNHWELTSDGSIQPQVLAPSFQLISFSDNL